MLLLNPWDLFVPLLRLLPLLQSFLWARRHLGGLLLPLLRSSPWDLFDPLLRLRLLNLWNLMDQSHR